MKRIFRTVIFGTLGTLLACAAGVGIFLACGTWLVSAGDRPDAADAIILLAGEPTRALYAADLYHQGFAPKVYISKPARSSSQEMLDILGIFVPNQEEVNKAVLLKKGVPEEDIAFFGQSSLSTAEEAAQLKRQFEDEGVRLLVVTSWYHARRAKIILRDFLKGTHFSVVTSPYESFHAKWWATQDSSRAVVTESIKLLFYILGGRFYSGSRE